MKPYETMWNLMKPGHGGNGNRLGQPLSIILSVQDKGLVERLLVEELDKLGTLSGSQFRRTPAFQRIGLREFLQERPIFNGKIHSFL
jgi:hypothetical protein